MPLSCEDFSSLSLGNTCISMPVPSSRYSLPSSSYRSSPYLSSSLERSYGSRTIPRTHSKATSSYSSTSSCSSYSRKSSLSDDSTVSSLISNTHNLSVREKSEIRDNASKTRNDVSNYLSRRYSHTASATLAGLELYNKYLPSNYIGSNTGKVSSAKPPLSQSDYSSSLYSISKSARSATSPVVERASSSIGSRLAEKSYTTSTATRGSTFPSLEHQGSLKTPSSKSEVILNLNHAKKHNYDKPSISSSEDDNSAEDNNGNDLKSYVTEVKHEFNDVEGRGADTVGHKQLGVIHSSQNTQHSGKTTKRSSAKSQSSSVLPGKLNSSESTTSSSSSEEEDEESDDSEEKDTLNKSMKSGRLGEESNETLRTRKSNVATLGIAGSATSAADNYSSLCSNHLTDHPFVSSISNKQHSGHGSPDTSALDGSYSSLRSSHHQTHRSPKSGLIGLRNIGNTCFMNSVIQCLSNTKPLLEYLLGDCHLSDINTTVSSMKGALIKAFSTVVQALWRPGSDERVVNTTSLKSQIQRFAPRFMGFNQQDAQEFLRYLLEGLHEDVNRVTTKPIPILTDIDEHLSDQQKASESWKRYLRIDDSKIVDIFVGQLKSTLRCTSCGHSSVTFDPFWDLSLPIPSRTGQVRLQQCFEVFTREEILDGDEKPTCSKCEMRRKCTKSLTIQKFPKILVIHLKRFSPVERFRGKLSINVDFPVNNLDLSAYAANKGQSCAYHLYGVANHSGTSYSGHYTAYCKHPYSGEWHEYNDSRVYGISSRSVVTSEAYVLFYELSAHDYKDYLS